MIVLIIIGLSLFAYAQPEVEINQNIKNKIEMAKTLKKDWNIEKALETYINILIQYPETDYIYDVHMGIQDCLERVQPTPEAKQVMMSGDINLIQKYGKLNLEKSGLEELMKECDEIISNPNTEKSKKRAYEIIKGYIYLTARFSGSQPPSEENIDKAMKVFDETLKSKEANEVLNGIIGYSNSNRYKNLYDRVHKKNFTSRVKKLEILKHVISDYPDAKPAAFAQKEIADWYIDNGSKEEAFRETEKLLKYKDYVLEYTELKTNNETLHGIATSMKKRIEKTHNK